ncbi:branched-chain amino acid ABC transporter permease [Maritalea myrionectae]|uniref:High-affinity branched-chain amino acid transport system permease protein BraD n=1 Tax=Maritalea myrionectae TaxID=454601 RepID=A0A2R4MAP6_9HYPH|nr:branched-chain amino acid ABC transporter permease [Maritalea myrionectae]AVX03025.1 high-affinity branched-chain amino acid transport system permease protein BraD [Maritalea myrionectae]
MMNELIFFFNKVIVSGAVLGSVYALGAVGITLIFGILRFAHFAHGDMMTMGAFVAFVLASIASALGISTFWPTGFIVLPFAMVITAGLALGIDRTFYQPLRAKGVKPVTLLIASIGVTLMIQGLIRLFGGVQTRSFFENESKQLFRFDVSWLGASRTVNVSEPQLLLIAVTVIAVVALHFFLTRSRLGKGMRAMADNPSLALVSGINTNQVVRATWIIAGSLAAMAGTMLALDVILKPDLAFNIVLPIFAAAIVGGLGQAYGAIAGGLIIGFAETMSVFNWAIMLRPFRDNLPEWVPNDLSIVPTEYKLTVAFVILVVVLLVRPTGIFKGVSS